MGTGLFCPVLVSPRPGGVALFGRSPTGELFYQEREGSGWGPTESLGVPVAHIAGCALEVPVGWQLAACPASGGDVALFATSPEGDLLHMAGRCGQWGTFECLGTPASEASGFDIPIGLTGAFTACSVGPGRAHVFALGQDGNLLHTSQDGAGWTGFESLGATGGDGAMPLVEALSACACGETALAIFFRGARGDLLLKWWDGARWSAFVSLGSPEIADLAYPAITVPAPLTGPPAACSWGANRLDVFARGSRGELLHKCWDGTNWSGFVSLGMPADGDTAIPFAGAVTACTSGVGRLDVLARAVDGHLYHGYWDGAWQHEA